MEVKIKKLNKKAVIPFYATPEAVGMDLTAVSIKIPDNEHVKYGFGLAMEIPIGYAGFIFPRSSSYKQRQIMSNCVGVIDPDYRGEISAVFLGNCRREMYQIGDRVAQIVIMPYPKIKFKEIEDLSKTERGDGGYGHTGN